MTYAVDPPIRIRRVRLENVRGFGLVEFMPGPMSVVIGRNGTNKTTLLRALALGLADPASATALLAQPVGRFVRSGTEEARIDIEVVDHSGVRVFVSRVIRPGERGEEIEDIGESGFIPVFAYGAGRGVVGGDSSRTTEAAGAFDHLLSLFDYRRELADPELTLRRLQDSLGESVYEGSIAAFRRILELGPDDRIDLAKGGGIELSGPTVGGGTIALAGWADGYRMTLSWLIDFFGRASRDNAVDEAGNVRGILLIDELDQHLHPALQAGMVDHLQALLPAVQIIATTHSPLLALGAEPSELVVLKRHGDEVRVAESVPDYRGYSAEDMLADDRLFDAPVYAPRTAERVERYGELLGKGSTRTDEEEQELFGLAAEMRAEALPQPVDEKLAEAVMELDRRLGSG